MKPRVGAFGEYGGRYVPELLVPALEELEKAMPLLRDPAFRGQLDAELGTWAGRPTPVTRCERFAPGVSLYLKREDLLHGGAHKTNNAVGQALLARRMGKTRLIAETGAGQHGTATAMIGARLGMEVVIYMGASDVARQAANVARMKTLGAAVVPVESGAGTLKDAINEALRDWTTNLRHSHYLLGTVCGPHPFPTLVRELQSVIGREAREAWRREPGGLPDVVVACVGGGSNAIGMFNAFRLDKSVQLVGVEPAGRGLATGQHGATLIAGSPGLLHGARTYILQDADGQIREAHSISAGLDYPGVGPEHAMLKDQGRVAYVAISDDEALAALRQLCRTEGIIPALESAHALAWVLKEDLQGKRVLVNLSGRGDKDMAIVEEASRC
ncbi:MAG: tryptophan synthase subunit beta [Deltaproteobacteria bacterium]|nr:tryptophan synthase subunit beta [Deltaproteobacteria bacterium]